MKFYYEDELVYEDDVQFFMEADMEPVKTKKLSDYIRTALLDQGFLYAEDRYEERFDLDKFTSYLAKYLSEKLTNV